MKIKSRVISIILTLMFIATLALAGCSQPEQAASSAPQGASQAASKDSSSPRTAKDPYKDEIKIGFITTLIGHSVPVAWSQGMERELKTYPNIKYQAFDGKAKPEVQVQIMQDLINQKYDCIVLQASDAAALSSAVTDAEKAGIPVITLNLDVTTPHAALVQMVDYEAGRIVAENMSKQLNGKGNVVILQSPPGASLGVNRERGFRDEIKKYPDIKIVGAQNAEWMKDKAMAVMNSFLQANPKIDGVYGINDSMAEGAALAAESAGRLKEMVIWGADGEKDALTMIEEGKLTGTIYTNCFDQGKTAARLALHLISSGIRTDNIPQTGVIKLAPIAVTKDNVSQILPADRW